MRINKKNLEKNKSLSFLLIFWDKENVFFFLYYETEYFLYESHKKKFSFIVFLRGILFIVLCNM